MAVKRRVSGDQLPATRLVGAVDSAGRGLVVTEPMPKLKRHHVLVRIRASMVSPGTQLGAARQARLEGKAADNTPPTLLGYQAAGEVVALGQGVTQFQVGDRVACIGGEAKHTDWATIPQNLCFKLPEGVSYEEASAMNLVLTAVQAVRRGEPTFGENLLVVGMGLVGQLTAQVGHIAGQSVMAADTVAGRLRIAKRCGITGSCQVGKQTLAEATEAFTRGEGFDMAVLAIGGDGSKALEDAVNVMQLSPDGHRMGRIILVGGLSAQVRGGAWTGNVDIRTSSRTGPGYHDPKWELGQREYPPVFIRWSTTTNAEAALRWIDEGRMRIKPMITHRVKLKDMPDAVDLLLDTPAKAVGVVVES